MKQKILSAIVVVILCFTFTITAFAASSSYDFTMSQRYVSGADHGIYHNLAAGAAKISGYQNVTANTAAPAPIPGIVRYALYKEQIGIDPEIGIVSGGNSTGDVGGTFSSSVTASSNYYLIVYKADTDGWLVTGYGTIRN
ncbi:MAG: hypothetical protein LBL49_10700 [Clostridiales Family XIII bacterium]|jgi:hypothetical protein|nr:hypothetical protein [Clostridiales Family XIII bacterium]